MRTIQFASLLVLALAGTCPDAELRSETPEPLQEWGAEAPSQHCPRKPAHLPAGDCDSGRLTWVCRRYRYGEMWFVNWRPECR